MISTGRASGKQIILSYPLVDVSVLKLYESCTDGRNVALLTAERNTTCALRVFELGVGVDPGIAHTPVQTVHDHSQLN